MNKYLFILSFAGAAFFSACSNSEDLSIGDFPSVDEAKGSALIFEAKQDSEIPITLRIAQGRAITRKPIDPTSVDSEGYGNFSSEIDDPLTTETNEARYLGVFCLATGYQFPYKDNPPIINKWKDDNTGLLVRMKNVPAIVENGDITFKDVDNEGNVSGSKEYYYPIGKWMKYNFYAYYPWQETNASLEISENTVVEMNYEIDGSQDIIWGMANPDDNIYNDAPDGAEPFSASYFRWKKADIAEHGGDITDYYPQFSFKHKLVQFRFFIKAANSTALGKDIKVTAMSISNAIYKLKLVVADKRSEPKNVNGDLRIDNSNGSVTKELKIKYVNPTDKTDFQNTDRFGDPYSVTVTDVNVNTATPVGYIMLPSPSISKESGFKYKLDVTVNYSEGTATKQYEINPPDGRFIEGKIYNIVISIDV